MLFRVLIIATVLTVLAAGPIAPIAPAAAQAPSVQVYFSPEDQPSRPLIALFDRAQRQILFAIYDETSRPIADALVAAARRHVDVWGIMDAGESRSRGNLYPEIKAALGAHLALRSGMGGSGIMHDKYAVIDGAIVVAGSYNWSYSADRVNRENLLVIADPVLAQQFGANFRAIWDGR